MTKATRYPPELRERAMRLLREHRDEHPSEWAAIEYVGPAYDWDREVIRGSTDEAAFTVFYLHQSRLADHTTIFTPGLTQTLQSLHGFGFSDLAGKAAVARTTLSQAYLLAADDIFWASGWICLALIGLVWLCKRSVSGGGAPVAAD